MTVSFGVTYFPTAYAMPVTDLARAAEERGFESLWVAEHTHIPASRKSPWPGGPNLPAYYHDVMDPFVSLAAAAAVTKKIKLGTGICLIVERDPITTAKEVTTLDRVSGGRFLFGIGGGWNAEEMENHGTEFKTRFSLMKDRIEAMKAIWTQEMPEYHGKFVQFDKMLPGPQPVQQPHPPIIIGGGWPHAAKRAIDYGNGWIPIVGRDQNMATLAGEFRKLAKEAGRDPDKMELTAYGAPPKPELVTELVEAGMNRIVFGVPMDGADKVLPALDAGHKVMEQLAA